MLYDVSWASSKFFLFLSFLYYLLIFLANTLILQHPLPIDNSDGEGWSENERCDEENAQETSYVRCLLCMWYDFFTFSFHFYIANFFF